MLPDSFGDPSDSFFIKVDQIPLLVQCVSVSSDDKQYGDTTSNAVEILPTLRDNGCNTNLCEQTIKLISVSQLVCA